MAITQALCTSFKLDLLKGDVDFDTDTFKIALYTSSATLGAATTAYTTTNEISGTGYTAGGKALTTATPTTSGTTAFIDFNDVTWSNATFTARGALIYNDTAAGKNAVAVINFGEDKTATGGNFVATMPAADASNAIVRIA